MSSTNTPGQRTSRPRPDFPVNRGLFQTKSALIITPLFMLLCLCLFCSATAYMAQQTPANASPSEDVAMTWFFTLCCGGGVLAALYVAFLLALGKLFNKVTDEGIERDAEALRRGLRE